METDNRHQDFADSTGIHPDTSGGKATEAGQRRSYEELEREVAMLSAKNAELVQANSSLAHAQRLLQTILDNMPDEIYFKDARSCFMTLNQPVAKNLGIAEPSQAIGKNDFDFFPSDQAKEFFEDEQKLMKKGNALVSKIEKRTDSSGRNSWTSTTKVPMRAPDGKIVGLLGINRDITTWKTAEQDLQASEEKLRQLATQLERSNRELQDFAYVASHDLQEPLRKIMVFGERLKEKNSSNFEPESLDYLNRMQKAAARMQSLINDLLAFSRITTKAQPFATVNLAEVAAGVLEDLESRIELVKGRVEVGHLPVIDAEPLLMRQLLQNLIGNALKFRRPEEPPVVKVDAQIIQDSSDSKKKLCQLTVRDNGIGFDEKYLDRIFDAFQRLHTRNEYEGTGMGLAIVRKIALYHKGDVTAKSILGEGSVFIITIPSSQPQTK